MAVNWNILDGDSYVSAVEGNDTTGDGSQGNPWATMQKSKDTDWVSGVDFKMVVGSGTYNENFFLGTLGGTIANNFILIADGYVLMDGFTTTGTAIDCSNSVTRLTIDGFVIKNYDKSYQLGAANASTFFSLINCRFENSNISSRHEISFPPVGEVSIIDNCVYKNNTNFFIKNADITVTNTIFINETFNGVKASKDPVFKQCTFKNTIINEDNRYYESCHFEPDCDITFTTGLPLSNWDYNNVRCPIHFAVQYADLAAFRAAYPANLVNCIDANPLFNGANADDLTISTISPNILAGFAGATIGAFEPTVAQNAAALTLDADLQLTGSYIEIIAPATSGVATTTQYDLGCLKRILSIPIHRDEIDSANVIDFNNTDSSNRRVYEMRYGTIPLTTEPYKLFEIDKKPTVDSTGKGNGNDAFDNTTAVEINARYLQVRLTLRIDGIE